MTTVDDYKVRVVALGEHVHIAIYPADPPSYIPLNGGYISPPNWLERRFGITHEDKIQSATEDLLREQIKTDSNESKTERIVRNFPDILDRAKWKIREQA